MERSPDSEGSLLDSDEALERSREVLGSPLHEKSTHSVTFRSDVKNQIPTFKRDKITPRAFVLSSSFRVEATLVQSTDRIVRRDGISGRGFERNADRRARAQGRVGIREGAEEPVHLLVIGRAESTQATSRYEEEESNAERYQSLAAA